MSELYNRSIEVYVPNHGIEPINIFHSEYKSDDAPIRLCYMDGNHYNAVIDPLTLWSQSYIVTTATEYIIQQSTSLNASSAHLNDVMQTGRVV